MFPILKSRNRLMNTFIIINIPPHVRDSSWDKLCFSIPKSPYFSLQFSQEQNIFGHLFERRAYQFILKATKVFPIYSYTGRVDRIWTFLLILI